MSRLIHNGMMAMVLYVISAAANGVHVLGSGAIGGCYAASRRFALVTTIAGLTASIFSLLGWITFVFGVFENDSCRGSKRGAAYIMSLMGTFVQFFAGLTAGAHMANLVRLERRQGSASYLAVTGGAAMPVPKGAASADSLYTPLPAAAPPAGAAARSSYGTTSGATAPAPRLTPGGYAM